MASKLTLHRAEHLQERGWARAGNGNVSSGNEKSPEQIKNIFGSFRKILQELFPMTQHAATAVSSACPSGQRGVSINRKKPEVTKISVSLPESVQTCSSWHLVSSRRKRIRQEAATSLPALLWCWQQEAGAPSQSRRSSQPHGQSRVCRAGLGSTEGTEVKAPALAPAPGRWV